MENEDLTRGNLEVKEQTNTEDKQIQDKLKTEAEQYYKKNFQSIEDEIPQQAAEHLRKIAIQAYGGEVLSPEVPRPKLALILNCIPEKSPELKYYVDELIKILTPLETLRLIEDLLPLQQQNFISGKDCFLKSMIKNLLKKYSDYQGYYKQYVEPTIEQIIPLVGFKEDEKNQTSYLELCEKILNEYLIGLTQSTLPPILQYLLVLMQPHNICNSFFFRNYLGEMLIDYKMKLNGDDARIRSTLQLITQIMQTHTQTLAMELDNKKKIFGDKTKTITIIDSGWFNQLKIRLPEICKTNKQAIQDFMSGNADPKLLAKLEKELKHLPPQNREDIISDNNRNELPEPKSLVKTSKSSVQLAPGASQSEKKGKSSLGKFRNSFSLPESFSFSSITARFRSSSASDKKSKEDKGYERTQSDERSTAYPGMALPIVKQEEGPQKKSFSRYSMPANQFPQRVKHSSLTPPNSFGGPSFGSTQKSEVSVKTSQPTPINTSECPDIVGGQSGNDFTQQLAPEDSIATKIKSISQKIKSMFEQINTNPIKENDFATLRQDLLQLKQHSHNYENLKVVDFFTQITANEIPQCFTYLQAGNNDDYLKLACHIDPVATCNYLLKPENDELMHYAKQAAEIIGQMQDLNNFEQIRLTALEESIPQSGMGNSMA